MRGAAERLRIGELLDRKPKALSGGQASKAYSLASQAKSKGGGAKAAELMVQSACKMGSASSTRVTAGVSS